MFVGSGSIALPLASTVTGVAVPPKVTTTIEKSQLFKTVPSPKSTHSVASRSYTIDSPKPESELPPQATNNDKAAISTKKLIFILKPICFIFHLNDEQHRISNLPCSYETRILSHFKHLKNNFLIVLFAQSDF